ncbi:AMP-binding protein [Nocardioides sp. BGMRC 2183]|nr:AMP-binding protein [Nocardioides sp. BGMRC 2183]
MDILRAVEHWAQRQPDAPAVRDEGGDIGWAALLAAARRDAARLVDVGVRPGDRIGVLMLNGRQFCVSVLGGFAAGAVVVPINHRLHPTEVADQLIDSGARVLVHDDVHADVAAVVATSAGVALLHPDRDSWADGDQLRVVRDLDDVATLLYSSGTTGRPRGVAITHRSIFAMSHDRIVNDGWSRDTRTYVPYPLAFSAGLLASWLATAVAGGLTVVDAAFDPGRALRRFEEDGITVLMAVPALWQAIVAHPDVETTDVSTLSTVSAGGAMVTPELMQALRARGILLSQGYGLTESSGVATALRPEDIQRKPGSIGRPMMLTESRVVAPDGSDCAPGEPGELWLRGPAVMAGYWSGGTVDPASLTDGWLATGDVASSDDEGYLWIVDRLKDMIITGGINVVPAEIERALESIPGVVESAVVGAPHPRWGETPYAFVVTSDRDLTGEQIGDALREQIARYKVPSVIEVRPEALPRSANGKVLRRSLREEARLAAESADEPDPTAIRELVERYFAAVNARDWPAFAATLHPEITIRQGDLFEAHGVEAVTKLYRAIVRQYAEGRHEDRPTRILVDGSSATVEITFTGHLVDGTEVTFPAMDVIDIEAGAIRRVSTWYDTDVVVPLIQRQQPR